MAYIQCIDYYLPKRIVSNDELFESFDSEGLVQAVKAMGVEQRCWANEDETSGDMAEMAAKQLFEKNNIDPETIDFLIFCSQGMDHFMPSTSCIIQNKLGIPTSAGAYGFDLGCSGFVYGLAMANSFVDSGLAKNVLLLTADTTHKYIHPNDKNRFLFGDAASATIIAKSGIAEIGKFALGTDGSGADVIMIKNGSWRNHKFTGVETVDENGEVHRDDWFFMDGNAVFNFTVDCIPHLLKDTFQINDVAQGDIDYYVFHQANKFMLNTLRKFNSIPKERFFVDLHDTGNTASSTVPIGIVKAMTTGEISNNMKVMIAGFGVGLSWAGTVLTFK